MTASEGKRTCLEHGMTVLNLTSLTKTRGEDLLENFQTAMNWRGTIKNLPENKL
jgi:hypothetical protein